MGIQSAFSKFITRLSGRKNRVQKTKGTIVRYYSTEEDVLKKKETVLNKLSDVYTRTHDVSKPLISKYIDLVLNDELMLEDQIQLDQRLIYDPELEFDHISIYSGLDGETLTSEMSDQQNQGQAEDVENESDDEDSVLDEKKAAGIDKF